MDKTYKIVRLYRDSGERKVLKTGLSIEEAKEWCSDTETSSATCELPQNIKHTEDNGFWFDVFYTE